MRRRKTNRTWCLAKTRVLVDRAEVHPPFRLLTDLSQVLVNLPAKEAQFVCLCELRNAHLILAVALLVPHHEVLVGFADCSPSEQPSREVVPSLGRQGSALI